MGIEQIRMSQTKALPPGRVRWWRGSGLRMMPTFPPPPLSFRTASFPQYGWKVGLSGSAFPRVAQVKPAPGIPCSSRRFASALRAPRCPTLRPALCRNSEIGSTLPCEELSPLPQRPSLRSGFYCPSPSTLNRPHPSHSQAHPVFAAWRFIRDAFAVLVRLGDPQVVPCFHCAFLLSFPIIRFRWDEFSRLHWFAIRYGLSSCLPPWRIRPGVYPSRQRLLLPGFRRVGHPSRRRV